MYLSLKKYIDKIYALCNSQFLKNYSAAVGVYVHISHNLANFTIGQFWHAERRLLTNLYDISF